jgi:hypothetical protein
MPRCCDGPLSRAGRSVSRRICKSLCVELIGQSEIDMSDLDFIAEHGFAANEQVDAPEFLVSENNEQLTT